MRTTSRERARAARPRHRLAKLIVCLLVGMLVLDGHGAFTPASADDETSDAPSVWHDMAYRDTVDWQGEPLTLRLDLYRPAGDRLVLRPVIVWVHAGGFSGGSKDEPFNAGVAKGLASLGYVVAVVDYRERPTAVDLGPEFTQASADARDDVLAAVAWLRSWWWLLRIDPTRVGLVGLSAGGITALNAAYSSPFGTGIRAAVSVSGMATQPLLPGPLSPPSLMLNGEQDPWIPFSAATQSCAAIDLVAPRCTIRSYPDDHFLLGHAQQVVDEGLTFLNRELKPAELGWSWG